MPTSTSMPMLSHSELDSMLSLSDSELEGLLTQIPAEQARRVMGQLRARSSMDRRIPMAPTARQAQFLELDCEEALYGGAARGGKSEALLLWLAEPVKIPGYGALILRRETTDLKGSQGGLVEKSHNLYPPIGGVFNGTNNTWTFPTGGRPAIIKLGSMQHEMDMQKFLGHEFHRIAFDELTTFTKTQYLFLHSRRSRDPSFPIRTAVRSTSNPGGIGHQWVMERFITKEALEMFDAAAAAPDLPSDPSHIFWSSPDRCFIPARIADNPFVSLEEYMQSVSHLPRYMWARYLLGDWRVIEDALIKESWFRYYNMQGQYLRLYDATGKQLCHCDERDIRQRVVTVDTAGTSEDKVRESRGKSASWSVAETWDYLPSKFGRKIALRHVWRKRVGYPELREGIKEVYSQWRPGRILIEDKHFGPALAADLRRDGLPASTIGTGQRDKVTRATDLLNMLESGEVFLPDDTVPGSGAWMPALTSEWLSWQGLEDETADQIDTAAYAAMEAVKGGGRVVKLMTDPRVSKIPAFNSID